MKMNPRIILLAVGSFFAAFFVCLFVMRPPKPEPIVVASTPIPTVTLIDPVLTPQFPHIDEFSSHDPDKALRALRALNPGQDAPEMRRGYFDLIDTQYRPTVDLKVSE